MKAQFNGLFPSEAERLFLLIEEAGEVQHIVGKILRRGYQSYHPEDPDYSNRKLLEKELGDLLFAIDLMIRCHDVDEQSIEHSKRLKSETVQQYLHHQSRDADGNFWR
uniref:Putative nucleotide pyrophosphohydrolase domain-containing protein n=1 Tax=viral metagenome TaxID=1070528 RepID=A0A6M3LJD3_9ZZZZ